MANNFAVHQIDYVLLTLIKSPKSLSLVAITLLVSLFTGNKDAQLSKATLLNVLIFSVGLFFFNLDVGVSHEANPGEDCKFWASFDFRSGVGLCRDHL